jgi:hypothetical protein
MARPGWTNKLDETKDLTHRSDTPSIYLSLETALKTFGGWSRLFGRSSTTYDQEVIIHRESDPGFWIEYGKSLAMDQFREVVADSYKEFRLEYPEKKISKKELVKKLEFAILQSGWVPTKTPILKEIRKLRKIKREEIKALRGGRTKKEWQKHLRESRKKEKQHERRCQEERRRNEG